ncbi:hypothetical protein MGG_17056 [Pyricularia oryzae 70-15]|uniref:Uncharacterized protein n=1 Tax=Pyricularia oryzae (strain 70-15 / ATCC MYA-4617 / FGSC 8958) TaxID=242507 RepID=G4N733_PYRO7|nr:uncharacterized protein MGG_17056 [Pyricularia oryzae 70-15]EHA49946.1 hypothetical protein MGG_17056 [Pyricularia oryzae 70-15]
MEAAYEILVRWVGGSLSRYGIFRYCMDVECRNCVVGLQESKKNETAHFPNGGDPQSHLAKWVGLESQRGRGNKKVRQPARNLIEWLGFVAPVWMDTQS